VSKGIKKSLKHVTASINSELRMEHAQLSGVGRALQGEGYVGGYLQALRDVGLALNGITPNNSRFERYWRAATTPDAGEG